MRAAKPVGDNTTNSCGKSQRLQATRHEPLTCHPNELRDLIRELPSHKAAGPDGAPSQLLKSLTYKQITALAKHFTTLANTDDYRTPLRPDTWDHNQTHKLYTKWLLILATPTLDAQIMENQLGFRRTRQPSEALFTPHRLTELAQEWEQPLTIMRLDLSKAFDRMKQSSILQMLTDSGLPTQLALNLSRELIGTHITPHLYGITSPDPIALARGAKQGLPESGLLFVSTLNWILSPLATKWEHNSYGVPIGEDQLSHLVFVDDLLLISPHPNSIMQMLRDFKPRLSQIGLELNEQKTAYITINPALATKLPGKNENEGETWHLTKLHLHKLRGAEMRMLRSVIPAPPENSQQTTSQKIENHKTHVRKISRTKTTSLLIGHG